MSFNMMDTIFSKSFLKSRALWDFRVFLKWFVLNGTKRDFPIRKYLLKFNKYLIFLFLIKKYLLKFNNNNINKNITSFKNIS